MRKELVAIAAVLAIVSCIPPALQADDKPPVQGCIGNECAGAAIRLSAESALLAGALIRRGEVYSLAAATGPDTPTFAGRHYAVEVTEIPGGALGSNKLTGLDDRLVAHVGIGSQIDGLAHIGIDGTHFNGRRIETFYRPDGVTAFGVETIPPIVTRGLLLDMAALYDADIVPADTVYTADVIEAVLKKQGIVLRDGDVVIFHSGWGQLLKADPDRWNGDHPGPDPGGARMLAQAGVIAVGADTPALERKPSTLQGAAFPVHQILLAQNGIFILEALATDELAANRVHEFAFVLGVPRLGGAVQAPINPIAIR